MQPAEWMSGKLQLLQLMCTKDEQGEASWGSPALLAAAFGSPDGSHAEEEHVLCGHWRAALHAHTLAFVSLMALDYLKSTRPPSFGFP